MSISTMTIILRRESRTSLSSPFLWGTFIIYLTLLSIIISHHELWGDEVHSWNIAKASLSFSDLISNIRYEGHPPVWYTILWSISKFTHDVSYIQLAQYIIASLIVFAVLFFSPFSLITRILIPFGYYFIFEYGALSRNYAIGVLFALCICIILHKNFRNKVLLYYVLLFLLSNVHLLTLLLACSFHFYFLLLNIEEKKETKNIALHILLGILVLIPSLYFIFPPSDSALNTHFWLSHWDIRQLIMTLIQPPLRAFVPIPPWWEYNFWNKQFLLEAQFKYPVLKIITIFTLLTLFAMLLIILKKNKKSLVLFVTNLLLSLIASVFLFLATARYSGMIFIGFIAAYWLCCVETPIDKKNKWFVNILLFVQIAGGIYTVAKDIQLPFSNAYKVNEVLNEIPKNQKVVTDYWALNALVAFEDRPFYVLEMHKEMSFLMWDSELEKLTRIPDRYCNGMRFLFQKEGIKETYMITIHPPQEISELDPRLFKSYKVKLIDKKEGAIERGGNLYLYQISAF